MFDPSIIIILKVPLYALKFQVLKSSLRILVWFEEGLVWGLVSGSVKTEGFTLGFQHFPWDLANVNEWKIMSDPSFIIINKVPRYALKTLGIILGFQTEDDTPGFQIFFTDLGLVCLMLNVQVNNFLVMLGLSHSFLGITSTF